MRGIFVIYLPKHGWQDGVGGDREHYLGLKSMNHPTAQRNKMGRY